MVGQSKNKKKITLRCNKDIITEASKLLNLQLIIVLTNLKGLLNFFVTVKYIQRQYRNGNENAEEINDLQ